MSADVAATGEPIDTHSPIQRIRNWFANPWGKPRFLKLFMWLYLIWSLIAGAHRNPVRLQRRPFADGVARFLVALVHRVTRPLRLARPVIAKRLLPNPEARGRDHDHRNAHRSGARNRSRPLARSGLEAGQLPHALSADHARDRHGGRVVPGVRLSLPGGGARNRRSDPRAHHVHDLRTWSSSCAADYSLSGRSTRKRPCDLGASPTQALRLVLLPMLAPAIWASLAIAFAISIDDFVISYFLQGWCVDRDDPHEALQRPETRTESGTECSRDNPSCSARCWPSPSAPCSSSGCATRGHERARPSRNWPDWTSKAAQQHPGLLQE